MFPPRRHVAVTRTCQIPREDAACPVISVHTVGVEAAHKGDSHGVKKKSDKCTNSLSQLSGPNVESATDPYEVQKHYQFSAIWCRFWYVKYERCQAGLCLH